VATSLARTCQTGQVPYACDCARGIPARVHTLICSSDEHYYSHACMEKTIQVVVKKLQLCCEELTSGCICSTWYVSHYPAMRKHTQEEKQLKIM
jgi:hypothetical protein